MPNLNRATIMGHLGKDPEIRSFQNGGRVANFSVATTEKWKDKNTGEQRERTEWHNIVVSRDGVIDLIQDILHKGDAVYIEGKIQTRKWQDKDGVDRYSTEIVVGGFDGVIQFLTQKPKQEGGYSSAQYANASGGGTRRKPVAQTQSVSGHLPEEIDDEVPF